MRPIRTLSVFPTLLTLGNLVCGFFAIVVASRVAKPVSAEWVLQDTRNVMIGGALIFLAMIFDGLDGYVARLSGASSDFGAQLDSLSDMVTFGVAPGYLLVKMCPLFSFAHNETIWVIAAFYACCAALRLARFNVETSDEDDHTRFSGLPSPAAAAAIAGFAIMFYTLRPETEASSVAKAADGLLQTILPFFAAFVALLMVSRIPYPHVVNQIFRGQRSFAHVVAVLSSVGAIMLVPNYAVPIICCAFVFYGPTKLIWEKYYERRNREESLF